MNPINFVFIIIHVTGVALVKLFKLCRLSPLDYKLPCDSGSLLLLGLTVAKQANLCHMAWGIKSFSLCMFIVIYKAFFFHSYRKRNMSMWSQTAIRLENVIDW